ncbi:MAG: hypothetical protein RI559_04035 [Marinospirillum sp.]|nr:hypothetical protein [Marinospirillum sp.]
MAATTKTTLHLAEPTSKNKNNRKSGERPLVTDNKNKPVSSNKRRTKTTQGHRFSAQADATANNKNNSHRHQRSQQK